VKQWGGELGDLEQLSFTGEILPNSKIARPDFLGFWSPKVREKKV
jgi:hypothetical protein